MISRKLLPPKLFYLFWFTTLGVYGPFITLYYREHGLSLSQIGILLALPGIMQIIAGPLWGLLADSLRIHRILLPIVVIGMAIPIALISISSGFLPILLLATLSAIFSVPVSSLSDSATLQLLGDQRERYGAQRVWGSVGWGASTVAAGIAVKMFGLPIIFWLCPAFALLAMLASLGLPGAIYSAPNPLGAAQELLRDRRWVRFLGSALLIGCASSLMHGFLSIYLADLGSGEDQIGLAFTLASVSELPVMALSPLVLKRWGPRSLLACAGFAYAIRLVIYILAPSTAWALAAQLLHGLGFAALWTAGVHEAQRLAPDGLVATAQSLFAAAVFGVAVVIANVTGGMIYQSFGYGVLFGAAAVLALAGAIGFLIPESKPVPVAVEI